MPIIYNDYVKQPNIDHDYTEEQIKEVFKCSQDLGYFLKYVKIISLDKGLIQFKPFEYQKAMLKMFKENRYCIVLSSRQSGKCVTGDQEIVIMPKRGGRPFKTTMANHFSKVPHNPRPTNSEVGNQ